MLIFLDVVPEYRKQGIAEELLKKLIGLSIERGKKGVVLTCKDHLVHYYSKFGFKHLGISSLFSKLIIFSTLTILNFYSEYIISKNTNFINILFIL